jgi:hypothetical protein
MPPVQGYSSPKFARWEINGISGAGNTCVYTYVSHRQHQVVNRTTPYIHTYCKEDPLGQLLVCLK